MRWGGAGSEVPFPAPAAVQVTWGRSVDPNSNAPSCCSWGPKLHAWGQPWAPPRYSDLWALPPTVPSTCPSAPHGSSLGCAHALLSTAARSSSHRISDHDSRHRSCPSLPHSSPTTNPPPWTASHTVPSILNTFPHTLLVSHHRRKGHISKFLTWAYNSPRCLLQ